MFWCRLILIKKEIFLIKYLGWTDVVNSFEIRAKLIEIEKMLKIIGCVSSVMQWMIHVSFGTLNRIYLSVYSFMQAKKKNKK